LENHFEASNFNNRKKFGEAVNLMSSSEKFESLINKRPVNRVN